MKRAHSVINIDHCSVPICRFGSAVPSSEISLRGLPLNSTCSSLERPGRGPAAAREAGACLPSRSPVAAGSAVGNLERAAELAGGRSGRNSEAHTFVLVGVTQPNKSSLPQLSVRNAPFSR